jgi:hypothetical protein
MYIFLYPIPGGFIEGYIKTIRSGGCIAPHFSKDVMKFLEIRSGLSKIKKTISMM